MTGWQIFWTLLVVGIIILETQHYIKKKPSILIVDKSGEKARYLVIEDDIMMMFTEDIFSATRFSFYGRKKNTWLKALNAGNWIEKWEFKRVQFPETKVSSKSKVKGRAKRIKRVRTDGKINDKV